MQIADALEATLPDDFDRACSVIEAALAPPIAVIGEHVDSFATLHALRLCGIEYAQGNWIGEPRRLAGLDLGALLPT